MFRGHLLFEEHAAEDSLGAGCCLSAQLLLISRCIVTVTSSVNPCAGVLAAGLIIGE